MASVSLGRRAEYFSRSRRREGRRMAVPVKSDEIEGYELAHERLIPALRRIASKELTELFLLAIAAVIIWNSQWGQLHLIKWEMARSSESMADDEALRQVAK